VKFRDLSGVPLSSQKPGVLQKTQLRTPISKRSIQRNCYWDFVEFVSSTTVPSAKNVMHDNDKLTETEELNRPPRNYDILQ